MRIKISVAFKVSEYQIKNKNLSLSYHQPVSSHCDCLTASSSAHAAPTSHGVPVLILWNHKQHISNRMK